jgi:Conserved protein/domain typically associated with flavoprotein oxygenases, DIM6/NTAB family
VLGGQARNKKLASRTRHLRLRRPRFHAAKSKAPFKFGQLHDVAHASAPAAKIAAMRQSVPLDRCTRLLNHGPTVLVSAESGGRRNVMAAAWSMPLDFTPPKVAVVLDKQTFTRTLIEASGHFVLAVPPVAHGGPDRPRGQLQRPRHEKFTELLASAEPGPATGAPLVDGCIAWLECRHLSEPHIEKTYDLFLGEVVAAWADDRVFATAAGTSTASTTSLRSLHHIAGGHFFAIGNEVKYTPISED